ncbi:MAG: transposase [Crenarchaeota archaeon]|nr:transposase [Thermoproteota archaeon]
MYAAVNQLGLPLQALVTPGNRFDGPFLPKLIEDLEADYVSADTTYSSKRNFKATRDTAARPLIADNPQKEEKALQNRVGCVFES